VRFISLFLIGKATREGGESSILFSAGRECTRKGDRESERSSDTARLDDFNKRKEGEGIHRIDSERLRPEGREKKKQRRGEWHKRMVLGGQAKSAGREGGGEKTRKEKEDPGGGRISSQHQQLISIKIDLLLREAQLKKGKKIFEKGEGPQVTHTLCHRGRLGGKKGGIRAKPLSIAPQREAKNLQGGRKGEPSPEIVAPAHCRRRRKRNGKPKQLDRTYRPKEGRNWRKRGLHGTVYDYVPQRRRKKESQRGREEKGVLNEGGASAN